MNYFPMFFDLAGQKVLIVGGGDVALRKLSLLERTGAAITVVAPAIVPDIMQRAAAGKLQLALREFAPDDLDGVRLVIVATSRRAVNRWIANLSESRNIPVNVVDDREASRFIVPAIVDRDPVLVAISTAGTSPVLARRLRERLEALIPSRIGELASWLRSLREPARQKLRDTAERRRFFEALVDGPAARRFLEGDGGGAERHRRVGHARTANRLARSPGRRPAARSARRSGSRLSSAAGRSHAAASRSSRAAGPPSGGQRSLPSAQSSGRPAPLHASSSGRGGPRHARYERPDAEFRRRWSARSAAARRRPRSQRQQERPRDRDAARERAAP